MARSARGRQPLGHYALNREGDVGRKHTMGVREIPLAQIGSRFAEGTRSLHIPHVVSLVQTIAEKGLLAPIVIDRHGRLLAGEHRLAAVELLSIDDDDARKQHFLDRVRGEDGKPNHSAEILGFAEVIAKIDRTVWKQHHGDGSLPVNVEDIDSKTDKRAALAIEIAENEKRKDYTKDDVKLIAERLKAAGYVDKNGRPKDGEVTLKQMLASMIGKSDRQVRRDLNDPNLEKKSTRTNTKIAIFKSRVNELRTELRKAVKLIKREANDETRSLENGMADLLKLVKGILEKSAEGRTKAAKEPKPTPRAGAKKRTKKK